MDFMLLVNFGLLATFGSPVAGKLIVRPRDTDAKVNQSTYLNCSTNHGLTAIFWYHGTKYVYTGFSILEPYNERFVVDRNVRNGTYIYNLVIRSVQPGDAGEYICAEDEGVGEKYSIQLVVLDGDPICRSNIELNEVIGKNTCDVEPDEVELSCSVTYHGNVPPHLEWKKDGDDRKISEGLSNVTYRNHYNYVLKLKGDISLDKSFYVCQATRIAHEPLKCISKVINVLYALSDNSTVNWIMDDEMLCRANTTQSCKYKWRWFDDNDVTTESSSDILKPRKTGLHKCEAECYLRTKTCNLLVMQAMVHGETESSQTRSAFISASVVVTVVVTLVLIVALIFVYRHRNRNKGDKAAENEGELLQFGREQFGTDQLTLNELLKQPVRALYGLAVLGREVFISRLRYSIIEVYDSTTFRFKRQIDISGMTNPEQIVSCSVKNCLYAFDWEFQNKDELTAMLRIDPSDGNLIKNWNVNGRGGRLSVASDTNVILNVNYEAKLKEYTADGELIREIILDSGTGIFRAWHAVKLPNGQFLVCHGGYDDPLKRICLLSIKTNASTNERTAEVEIMKAFGGEDGVLKGAAYLSLDKEGNILISDALHQFVMLTCNLDDPLTIVDEDHGLSESWRTCFDESTGQWIVTDYHRVFTFRVKDKQIEGKLYQLISH